MSLSPKPSPKKESVSEILSQRVSVQHLPLGKVIMVIGNKESKSGYFNNKRLLIYSENDKAIMYSKQFPKELPLTSIAKMNAKDTVPIQSVTIHKSKTHLNSLEIKSRVTETSKKDAKHWIFSFKTASLLDSVYQHFIEAQNQCLGKTGVQEKNYPTLKVTPPSTPSLALFKQSVEQAMDDTIRNPSVNAPSKAPQEDVEKLNERVVDNRVFRNETFNRIDTDEKTEAIINQDKPRFQIQPYQVSEDIGKGDTGIGDEDDHTPISYVRMSTNRNKPSDFSDYNQDKTITRSLRYTDSFDKVNEYLNKVQDQQGVKRVESKNWIETSEPHRESQKSTLLIRSLDNERDWGHNPNNRDLLSSQTVSTASKLHISTPLKKSYNAFHADYQQSHHQSQFNRTNKHPIQSLYKGNSTVKSKVQKSSLHPTDWNSRLFCEPNPYQVIHQFKQEALAQFQSLVDEYTLGKSNSSLIAMAKSKYSQNHIKSNIAYSIACYHESPQQFQRDRERMLNQYQDYKYLSSFMKEKDTIRIPLICLLRYKGVMALARAVVCDGESISSEHLEHDFVKYSREWKIFQQHLKRSCTFWVSKAIEGETIAFLNDLTDVLPKVQGVKIKANLAINYIRKNSQKPLTSHLLNEFRKKEIDRFCQNLNDLRVEILNSLDLQSHLETLGINIHYLGEIYQNSTIPQVRQILLTEMIASTSIDFMQLQLQKELSQRVAGDEIKSFIFSYFVFFRNLVSITGQDSADLYNIICGRTKKIYDIVLSDYYILPGYLMGALISKGKVRINYEELNPKVLVENDVNFLNIKHLEGFDAECSIPFYISFETISRIIEIVHNEPGQDGYEELSSYLENPNVLDSLNEQTLTKALIYSEEFQSSQSVPETKLIDFHTPLNFSPPTVRSLKVQYFNTKRCLVTNNQQQAVSILQNVCQLVFLWVHQFHPSLSEFYDLFSSYYLMINQKRQAMTLAKSSVINLIKIVGKDSNLIAEKYYLLANIQNACQCFDEALGNYEKVEEIFSSAGIENSEYVSDLMVKKAGIYVMLKDLDGAYQLTSQAFKVSKCQKTIVECYRIKGEIYREAHDMQAMKKNGSMCYSRFAYCNDPVLYSKILKIGIVGYLLSLSDDQCQSVLKLTSVKHQSSDPLLHYPYIMNLRTKGVNILELFIEYIQDVQELVIKQNVSRLKKSSTSPRASPHTNKIKFLEAVLGLTNIQDIIQ